MNIYRKVRIKLFLVGATFEIIVNGIIICLGVLTGRLLIALLSYIPFHSMRKAVPKIFHIRNKSPLMSLIGCGGCSCFIFFVIMKTSLPLSISLFSSVLLGMFANVILYKIEDYISLKKEKLNLLYKLCNMTDDELRAYAISKHLGETLVDTLVLRLKHNYKWCDIAKARNYSKDGIRYHKETLEKVLGIEL